MNLTITATRLIKGTVLLQTPRAIATSNGKSTPVRVLFDAGSQTSYPTTTRSETRQEGGASLKHVWRYERQNCGVYKLYNLSNILDYSRTLTFTKRSMLKLSSKIFDPLGLLAPFTVKMKILFQELCSKTSCWDDPPSNDLKAKWKSIFNRAHFVKRCPNTTVLFSIVSRAIQHSITRIQRCVEGSLGCCSVP